MKIGIFLTYGMSLKKWKKIGILDRELEIYNKLGKYNSYSIFTYEKNDKLFLKNKKIKIINVGKYLIFKNKYLRFLNSLFIPFFLGKYVKDIDILKSNQSLGSWVPAITSKIYKKKFIHRAGYDVFQNLKDSETITFFEMFILKYFYAILFKLSDLIILTNYFHRNSVKNITNKKILIIPNFINTKKFFPKKIKKYNKKILFVGRIHKEKNLNMIIQALKNTGYSLDIVGNGEKEYIKKLSSLAKKNKVNVNFKGSIRNSLLPNIYNKYKVFINFSDYEGNPKAVLEAMACGCLVICSNVRGNNEIIRNKINGFLVKKKILELNTIFTELNKIKKRKILLNSLKFINEKYTLEKIIEYENKAYKLLFSI